MAASLARFGRERERRLRVEETGYCCKGVAHFLVDLNPPYVLVML